MLFPNLAKQVMGYRRHIICPFRIEAKSNTRNYKRRLVLAKAKGKKFFNTAMSQAQEPVPASTEQPVEQQAVEQQQQPEVAARAADSDDPITGKPDASAIYHEGDLDNDILANQDPTAVHPDHENVNWNKETGEGFATEMDRHAIKAAQLHNLLPKDVNIEDMIKGSNKTGVNKDEFEKALQKPNALQHMADQPEEEIKPATAEAVKQAAN
jgi:hypothetical protein